MNFDKIFQIDCEALALANTYVWFKLMILCKIKFYLGSCVQKSSSSNAWVSEASNIIIIIQWVCGTRNGRKSHLSRLSVKHVSLDQVQPKISLASLSQKFDTFRM